MHSLTSLQAAAPSLLARYVNPASGYSFNTYDRAPLGVPNTLQPTDILAANCLSLRLGAPEVIPLFLTTPGPGPDLRNALDEALKLLSELDMTFEDFDSVEELDIALEPLAALRGSW